MKKSFLNVLFIALLTLIVTPAAFAGIPISESATTNQETVVAEKTNKKVKKVSKLKQKIAKKMLAKADGGDANVALAVILAIILPFVGVAYWQNGITKDFWITLLLWFLFYIPGLVYALIKILG